MFEILSVTGRVQFVRKLSPILDGKEHVFLICLFSASRQLRKKTVTTYLHHFKCGTQFSYALTFEAGYQEESLGQGKLFSCAGHRRI